ncbi:unnamed protein product [Urochloa humidicola]
MAPPGVEAGRVARHSTPCVDLSSSGGRMRGRGLGAGGGPEPRCGRRRGGPKWPRRLSETRWPRTAGSPFDDGMAHWRSRTAFVAGTLPSQARALFLSCPSLQRRRPRIRAGRPHAWLKQHFFGWHFVGSDNTPRAPYDFSVSYQNRRNSSFHIRIGGILLSSSMYCWEKANLVDWQYLFFYSRPIYHAHGEIIQAASSKATMKQASSKSDQKKSACANAEFFNPLEIITTNVQVNVYVHCTCHGSSILTESQTPSSIPQCLV